MSKHSLPAILALLWLPMAAIGANPWTPPDGARQQFEVYWDGKSIGQIKMEYTRDGTDLVVKRTQTLRTTKMMMKIAIDEVSEERWTNDQLTRLETRTELKSTLKDETTTLELTANADGQLSGRTAKEAISPPPGSLPFASWRAASLRDGTYFDMSQAKPMQIAIDPKPVDEAPPKNTPADCKGSAVTVRDSEDNKGRALFWINVQGMVCAMRMSMPTGVFDYAAVAEKD